MTGDNTFGSQLRRLRKEKGFSQFQLGSLLGVSDRAVSKWENGLAKPKSDVLVKLCSLLDITSDALLGIHIDSYPNVSTGADRKDFWSKTDALLIERYGSSPSLEILSRYEKEKSAFYNTKLPQLFSLLALLKNEAAQGNHGFEVLGNIGGCFIAFLLGVTDINSLPPHYYCPVCKSAEFVNTVKDGWDLPRKRCSYCGRDLQRDGHDIPFEVYSRSLMQNVGFDVLLDRQFYAPAEKLAIDFLGNYSLKIIDNPNILYKKKLSSHAVTFIMIADDHYRTVEKVQEGVSCAQFSVMLTNHAYINMLFDTSFDEYVALINASGPTGMEIDYWNQRLYAMLQNCKSTVIPAFLLRRFQEILRTNQAVSFSDLLQLFGVSLILAEYPSTKMLLDSNAVSAHNFIVYRDDMYQLIFKKLREHDFFDSALAYTIMNDIRTGTFFRSGINDVSRTVLESIGFSSDMIAILRRTPYLFPKAVGLIYLKMALTQTWYDHLPNGPQENKK